MNGGTTGSNAVNGGRVNGGLVNGGRVNGGRVNGGRVNGGRVNGGRVNGGRVNGGRVNGGRVNGGRVNGGRVNGGRVNGGRVNGGRVNGGQVNGGGANGNGILPVEIGAARWRGARRQRTIAIAVALVAVVSILPLISLLAPPSEPIVIDGRFEDWASSPVYPDALADDPGLADVNLVGYAAARGKDALYIWVETATGTSLFGGDPDPSSARAVRVLIDADRSATTGYSALGLGADLMVVVSGDNGSIRKSEVLTYTSSRSDRTDPLGFATSGAARAAFTRNHLEVAVPAIVLPRSSAPNPLLLVIAQSSTGAVDTGDWAFTSDPGGISVSPAQATPSVVSPDTDVLLASFEVRAVHAPMSLATLPLQVLGSGATLNITRVVFGATEIPVGAEAGSTEEVVIDLGASGPLDPGAGPRTLEVWGKASGAAGTATVRLVPGAYGRATTSGAPDGASGHVSLLPPTRFGLSYVGAAPASIRADGAFADWDRWSPLDLDPTGDVSGTSPGPSPGGPNGAPDPVGALDITASRAVVDPAVQALSFLLTVSGSIMSSQDLPAPPAPAYTTPSAGGAGGGAPRPVERGDTATLYIDSDGSPETGWGAVPGLGVDTVVHVRGTGGGWGRTPFVAASSVGRWDPANGTFGEHAVDFPVGLGSDRMEVQVPMNEVCNGACGAVRYAFNLESPDGSADATAPRAGSTRATSDQVISYESAVRSRVAYAGDRNAPVLAISLAAPSTNNATATVTALRVGFDGADMSWVGRVLVYRDLGIPDTLDQAEVEAGPLATAPLGADGTARLLLDAPVPLQPGSAVDLVVALDTLTTLPSPAQVTTALVPGGGVATAESLSWQAETVGSERYVRFLPPSPGSRGQNQIVINEINFNQGWVELYHTLGTPVSLTSPSQMGIEVWRTNPPANKYFVVQIVLGGTTDSNGYTTINLSIPYSDSGKTYFLSLWCNNCTAGMTAQGNNTTYVDSVEIPVSSVNGMWGRYPNGNGSFTTTTNDTRGAANQIPELRDVVLPVTATLVAVVARRRRTLVSGRGAV